MYDLDKQEEQKISKFNSGVAQLMRLEKLWDRCILFKMSGNLQKWNETLDCVWSELAADCNPKSDKIFNKFMELIIKYRKKNKKGTLTQILIKKEIWLRRLQNKTGKGTAYYDKSEDDFE